MNCIYKTSDGYCKLHSDKTVREPCVEGPCGDEVVKPIKAIEERRERLYQSDADYIYVEDYLADTEFLFNCIKELEDQLAEAKAGYEAAVEDLKSLQDRLRPCHICKFNDMLGCCHKNHCYVANEYFEWRGPVAGDGERDG